MYIYIDNNNFVHGFNPNNMIGNAGWIEIEGAAYEPLHEWHGVPLYKVVDGQIVERSEDEVAADVAAIENESEVTPDAPENSSGQDLTEILEEYEDMKAALGIMDVEPMYDEEEIEGEEPEGTEVTEPVEGEEPTEGTEVTDPVEGEEGDTGNETVD